MPPTGSASDTVAGVAAVKAGPESLLLVGTLSPSSIPDSIRKQKSWLNMCVSYN